MAINYLKLTATQLTKQRFKEGREIAKSQINLTLSAFREYVLNTEPSYNNPVGWEHISNTWYGRRADVRLTELINELNNQLI